MVKNTDDDEILADFSKPKRQMRTVAVNGVQVVTLGETLKDKQKSINDPAAAYRRDKDEHDYLRIKDFFKAKKSIAKGFFR